MSELKIVGGSQADKGQFPAVVRYVWPDMAADLATIRIDCTATKVSAHWFITAAHCVSDPYSAAVFEGLRNNGQIELAQGREPPYDLQRKVTVKDVRIHPTWSAAMEKARYSPNVVGLDGVSDVALLEIDEETPQVAVSQIDGNPLAEGSHITLVGYGCEDIMKPTAGRLKFAEKTIAMVGSVAAGFAEQDAQSGKVASACTGDSGGPSFRKQADGSLAVVGVTSYGDAPWIGSASTRKYYITRLDDKAGQPSVKSWLQGLLQP